MGRRVTPFPWANLALLGLLALQLVTGLVGLLGTSRPYEALFWLHAVGAYGIVVLLFAKGTIVLHAIRSRPGLDQARITLVVMLGLLLAVLVTGVVWISAGPLAVAGTSLVNWHAYLALLLVALLAWHVIDRRWIVRVPAARDRRAFLRMAGVVVAGVALWQAERTAQALLDTRGSRRRFTGSYEHGSFTGDFPAVSWFDDDPDPVDASHWRLAVEGEVIRPLELSYEDLGSRRRTSLVATIDCTGGWYSDQEWSGVSLGELLDEAGLTGDAKSVSVESVTGYSRRFSLGDARRLVLATSLAGRPLAHGHGFPLRLVVSDQRGFDWVKWVVRVRVLDSTHLLQPPLPLT
jgi:hypothetical protein